MCWPRQLTMGRAGAGLYGRTWWSPVPIAMGEGPRAGGERFHPQTMRASAAQAGEMVIRCFAPHPSWNGGPVGLTIRWATRPEEDGMTVTTPNLMRSLVVQERETLHRIVEPLLARFPELPAEQVEAAVVGRYRDFQHSRVRDFVPILVERRAGEDLEIVANGNRSSRTEVSEQIRSMRRQGAW
jgi:hypothetical protein